MDNYKVVKNSEKWDQLQTILQHCSLAKIASSQQGTKDKEQSDENNLTLKIALPYNTADSVAYQRKKHNQQLRNKTKNMTSAAITPLPQDV